MNAQQLLWQNIQLLGGFDRPRATSASSATVEMPFLCHFLLSRLDSLEARKRFHDCFPVLDRSTSTKFRAEVVRWLEQLKKQGCFPADVVIRKSCFDECRGDRYDRALLALSTHVLRLELGAGMEAPHHPGGKLTNEEKLASYRELEAQLETEMAKFQLQLAARIQERQEWQRRASALEEKRQQLLERQERVREWKQQHGKFQYTWDRLEDLQELQSLWNQLLAYLDQRRIHRLDGADVEEPRKCLDGLALLQQFVVPKPFARVWEQELQKEGVAPLQEGNNLHIASLLKLWKCVLMQQGATTGDAAWKKVVQLVGDHFPEKFGEHAGVEGALERLLRLQQQVEESNRQLEQISQNLDTFLGHAGSEMPTVAVKDGLSLDLPPSFALPSVDFCPEASLSKEQDLALTASVPTPVAVRQVQNLVSNMVPPIAATPLQGKPFAPRRPSSLSKSMHVPLSTTGIASQPHRHLSDENEKENKPSHSNPVKPSKSPVSHIKQRLQAIKERQAPPPTSVTHLGVDIVCEEIADFILDTPEHAKEHQEWQSVANPLGTLENSLPFTSKPQLARTPPAPKTPEIRRRLSYRDAVVPGTPLMGVDVDASATAEMLLDMTEASFLVE